MTQKERLFFVLLGVFCLWLAGLGTFTWYVLAVVGISNVESAISLLAGVFGAGLVTEFFLMALTLSWNYYFRKQATTPDAV